MKDCEDIRVESTGSVYKERLIELLVFLFLIVPSMLISLFAVRQGSMDFVLVAWVIMLRDLGLLSLVLFFVWRNGERFEWVGWSSRNFWREVLIGVGVFIPFTFSAGLVEKALLAAGFSSPSVPLPSFLEARDVSQFLLAGVLVVIVALTEESVFRGYLILRFKTITGSPTIAVILSAAIFSLGHGYEGSAGVITVGFMGIAFALVYLWRRSLTAAVVMHFLQDFIGIVIVPLMGLK
jgi:membrane protease YdiL (CAAX protease family)